MGQYCRLGVQNQCISKEILTCYVWYPSYFTDDYGQNRRASILKLFQDVARSLTSVSMSSRYTWNYKPVRWYPKSWRWSTRSRFHYIAWRWHILEQAAQCSSNMQVNRMPQWDRKLLDYMHISTLKDMNSTMNSLLEQQPTLSSKSPIIMRSNAILCHDYLNTWLWTQI